jgi:hypothetical protein
MPKVASRLRLQASAVPSPGGEAYMHTVKVILGGCAALAICLLAGRLLDGAHQGLARAALMFLPIWLAAALFNLWIGVTRAGYTIAEEAPIAAVVFGIPAAAAVLVWLIVR